MGSISDLKVMEEAVEICKHFGVAYEIDIVSAHRTPLKMVEYAQTARERGSGPDGLRRRRESTGP